MSNATLAFRVDPELKKNAMDYANEIGIPLSCLMTAFLKRFVAEGKVPFELTVPEIPNEETIQSFKDMEAGRGVKDYESVEAMAADLVH